MDLLITPKKLYGAVAVPSSKSMGHRCIIAAALGGGEVTDVSFSEDISATLSCMKALGIDYSQSGNAVTFKKLKKSRTLSLDCNESGSTLRFLIPLAVALYPNEDIVFKGSKRLLERPLTPYLEILGRTFYKDDNNILVHSELKGGEYRLSGKISSQFITGLMFALPLLKTPSKIIITDTLESRGYVDMTLDTLEKAGIVIGNKDYREFVIPCNQQYKPVNEKVEADFSQGAFFLTANFLGSDIDVMGLNLNSKQGDKAILEILSNFAKNEDITIDVSDIPDLVPTLAVAASLRNGYKTYFVNGARLRMKESDRIESTCDMITSLGGEICEGEDSITVTGKDSLSGGEVDCCNDHRIAMAAAMAATRAENEVLLKGAECVKKSYPHFWDDYKMLGGILKEDGR